MPRVKTVSASILRAHYKPVDRFNVPKSCALLTCWQPHFAASLCHKHYQQAYRLFGKLGKRVEKPEVWRYARQPIGTNNIRATDLRACPVQLCGAPSRVRGLCRRHYNLWYYQSTKGTK